MFSTLLISHFSFTDEAGHVIRKHKLDTVPNINGNAEDGTELMQQQEGKVTLDLALHWSCKLIMETIAHFQRHTNIL